MPTEFLHGRPLKPDELELIRQQIEHGFDRIEAIDPRYAGSSRATGRTCCPSFRPMSDLVEPIGGPLTLRHASESSSGGNLGAREYDVIDEGGGVVERIFRPGGDRYPERAWQ